MLLFAQQATLRRPFFAVATPPSDVRMPFWPLCLRVNTILEFQLKGFNLWVFKSMFMIITSTEKPAFKMYKCTYKCT